MFKINTDSLKKVTAFLLLITLGGCGINNVPTYDEAVNAAWAEVQNQYKRRADLIPNLVETVKGFAGQEKDVLLQVVEARSRVSQMNISPELLNNPQAFQAFEKNQAALSSALSRLMVVVERYPELKSNQNFLTLQSQLEGTENRIAVARRDYIASVQKYNTELRTIPGRWIAAILYPDAEVKPVFAASEKEQQAPDVNFTPDVQFNKKKAPDNVIDMTKQKTESVTY
ncbi:MAG TPA: LemA family protein [Chromatiales bacterium]|nr:LemA family protein [Thiotrichales bacterium]HIP67923.1 LemA family protein [Chromatiales bacterium]